MRNTPSHINSQKTLKKLFFLMVSLMLFFSCVEEIEFNETQFDAALVVKAILTDELKHQQVALTLANRLNTNDTIYETKAIVSIIDSSQKTHAFIEKSEGNYESILPFKAEKGIRYFLRIKTMDGEIYESSLSKIQGTNNIDEIYVKQDKNNIGEEGLTIFAKSESTNENAKYYKYYYKETYKIIAPYYSQYALRIISDVYPWKIQRYFQDENREICYNTIASINISQTETNSISKNLAIQPIRFIKKNDSIIAHRYSIEVEQHVQSYEAYTYYKTLGKLSNSENVFSQTQQGFLQGNIFATLNKEKKVIGFFEVNSSSKERIFFNHTDIFPDHYINTRKSCDLYAPPLTEYDEGKPFTDFSPLINLLKSGFLYFGDNDSRNSDKPGPVLIVQKRCGDCRIYGTIIKPSFWID